MSMIADPPAEPPTADPAALTTGKKRRHGWRFWLVLFLAVLLCGWLIYDRLDEPDADNTGRLSGTPTQQPQSAAASVAVTYESRSLAGDVDGTCRLDVREAACRDVLGAMPRSYTLSEPVTTVQSERLQSPSGAAQPVAYDAVIVVRTIQGQAPQRVAFLVTTSEPRKVRARRNIGTDEAGKTLQEIFKEEVR